MVSEGVFRCYMLGAYLEYGELNVELLGRNQHPRNSAKQIDLCRPLSRAKG